MHKGSLWIISSFAHFHFQIILKLGQASIKTDKTFHTLQHKNTNQWNVWMNVGSTHGTISKRCDNFQWSYRVVVRVLDSTKKIFRKNILRNQPLHQKDMENNFIWIFFFIIFYQNNYPIFIFLLTCQLLNQYFSNSWNKHGDM